MKYDKSADNVVRIFDAYGVKLDEIVLKEKIVTIPSKRGGFSDSGLYYKGSGSIYGGHMTNTPEKKDKVIVKSGLVYEKYRVIKADLIGMKGIFTFVHQPVFSDYEGGCGPKEKKVLDLYPMFERSAIEEIVDVIPINRDEHNIYVYRYKELSGNIFNLADLIGYVLSNNYNTAWDKNLISDIEGYGYVRDLADWYISDKISHKYGTVFAFLYSLYNNNIYDYVRLIKYLLNVNNADRQLIIYYAALITEKYCKGIFEGNGIDITHLTKDVYTNLFIQLYSGKACCHLEQEEKWDYVRGELLKTAEETAEKCWNRIK